MSDFEVLEVGYFEDFDGFEDFDDFGDFDEK